MPDRTHKFPSLKYHFQFKDLTREQERDNFFRRHRPEVIFTVPFDDRSIFLAGRYRGTGSVMKFEKKNGKLDYYVQLEELTQVAAIATTIDEREDYFFGCGYDEY